MTLLKKGQRVNHARWYQYCLSAKMGTRMEYTNGAENILQGEAYFTLNIGCISKRTCKNYIL